MQKKLLIGLSVILIGLGAFAAVVEMQPAEFRIARSIVVKAPPEKIFPLVNNLHEVAQWSPWNQYDPNMKKSFAGPEEGVGASQSWEGNDKVGVGKMTILESEPPRKVRLKLEFLKPMQCTNEAAYTLIPTKDGDTEVEWAMTGSKAFVQKAFCMFMDMDKMVGPDFERGLANLKASIESTR